MQEGCGAPGAVEEASPAGGWRRRGPRLSNGGVADCGDGNSTATDESIRESSVEKNDCEWQQGPWLESESEGRETVVGVDMDDDGVWSRRGRDPGDAYSVYVPLL